MHFLADRAVKNRHQSRSLAVPLSGRRAGCAERAQAWPAQAGRKRGRHCVCARPQWRRRGARGAGRAPARVLLAAVAGTLLFLSGRLGHRHVAVLARRPGLKEGEPIRARRRGRRRGRRGGRVPQCRSWSRCAVGTFATPVRCLPGLLLFSKCTSLLAPCPARQWPESAGPELREGRRRVDERGRGGSGRWVLSNVQLTLER